MADKPTALAHYSTAPSASIQSAVAQFQPLPSLAFPRTPTKDNSEMRSLSTTPPMAADPKKPLDISNLMSPPEPIPYDNFNAPSPTDAMRRGKPEKHQMPNPPLSPPISPFTKLSNNISPEPTLTAVVKDPILYPPSEPASSPPGPLFSPSFSCDARRLVDEHLAARPATLFKGGTSPPQREEYELALYFKSAVMEKFVANPQSWLRKERELLAADRKTLAAHSPSRLAPILPAKLPPSRPQQIRTNASRVQKPEKPRQPRQPKSTKQNARPPRAAPAPTIRSTIRVSTTPDEPRVRLVAPNREDKDFASLPDYSPPVSSLPLKPNSLKVDWKGNPLDLRKDRNAFRLHGDEVLLAASLRLDCATYLTSKRRIFIRRLECAKIGKEFRKTDAQQACKIDVNKASKLWTAFEKVGWLDIHWMDHYLRRPQLMLN